MVSYACKETPRRLKRPAKHLKTRVRSYSDIVAALPEAVGRKLKFDREVFAKSYALSKWMTMYGTLVLDQHEYMLLHFIAARTLHFGKRAEMITKEHFLRGVWSGKEPICGPVRMGQSSLYRTIAALERKGILSVNPVNLNGRDLPTIYEIEIDFINTLRPSEVVMSKLREPKAKRPTAEIVDFTAFRQEKLGMLGGSTRNHLSDEQVVLPRTTNNIKKNHEDNELVAAENPRNETASSKLRVRRKPRASAPDEIDCKLSPREVISVTLARSAARRDGKVAHAAKGSAITLGDLNATWKKAMIEAYGSCTIAGLTTKEYGMFKRITKAHELSCTWLEFFRWAISNWAAINRESKEYTEYKKRSSGDWSLKEEDVVLLGSSVPDLFLTIKNFGRLLKRYSKHTLGTRVVASESSDEVKALRVELDKAQREASTNARLLQKALSAKSGVSGGPVVSKKKPVRATIVNPETDTFFKDDSDALPQWGNS